MLSATSLQDPSPACQVLWGDISIVPTPLVMSPPHPRSFLVTFPVSPPPGDVPTPLVMSPPRVLQGPPQDAALTGAQVTPELLPQDPPECPPQLSPPHLDPQPPESPELGE